MPESIPQKTIEVGGRSFLWNRLPTTASVKLFSELAPAVLPAVVEVMTQLPLVVVDGKLVMHDFHLREMGGLADALRKLLKELPFERQMSIATQALRHTMLGTVSVTSDFDRHLTSEAEFYELTVRALILQYGGFSDVLAGLGLRLPGRARNSTESSTSPGPSGG